MTMIDNGLRALRWLTGGSRRRHRRWPIFCYLATNRVSRCNSSHTPVLAAGNEDYNITQIEIQTQVLVGTVKHSLHIFIVPRIKYYKKIRDIRVNNVRLA